MTLKQVFHSAADILAGRWRTSAAQTNFIQGNVSALKTGFTQLDRAMGVGGLPQGYLTELIGPDTSGAISVMAKIAAKFQRKQLPVLILDVAQSLSEDHLIKCGLIAPELLCQTPPDIFAMITSLEKASRQPGVVVLNFGFVPHTFGAVPAATLKMLLNRLRRLVSGSAAAFLCITHTKDANPLTYTNYLPAFPINEVADVRLWVQDEGWIKKGGEIGGYRGTVTVIKNNLAPSGKGANIRIPFVDPLLMRLEDELGF